MPRCKIAMRLIEGARAHAATYARRAKGVKKKADELATLCGVQVALVCTAGVAGVVPLEWESEEGVLDRYRALPPEIRAQHTLRNHLEAELCKERAKLARVQQQGPGSLADVGAALGDMTPAEARELLETINATLRATRKRLEALGLPADGLLEQTAADAVMAPQLGHDGFPCIGGNAGGMDTPASSCRWCRALGKTTTSAGGRRNSHGTVASKGTMQRRCNRRSASNTPVETTWAVWTAMVRCRRLATAMRVLKRVL
ncbi:hypothetical protein ACQ4PT_024773 [Festuca glaucescens]